MTSQAWLRAAADGVLVLHAAFVAFVVLGLMAIWIGYFRGWSFVRHLGFRVTHLLAMGVVVWQVIAEKWCPLTLLENALRRRAGIDARYESSFIEHWLHRILFFDLSQATFTVMYLSFFALIVASFVIVRPRRWGRE